MGHKDPWALLFQIFSKIFFKSVRFYVVGWLFSSEGDNPGLHLEKFI